MPPSSRSLKGTALERLAADLRGEAATLRRYHDERAAAIIESIVGRYDVALAEAANEILTLAQGEEESGYSKSHLRAMIAAGELENAGSKGRPRIRRSELPVNRRGPARATAAPASPPASQAGAQADRILARLGRTN